MIIGTNSPNQRGARMVNGYDETVYEVHFPNDIFDQKRRLLEKLQGLGLLYLEPDFFFVTEAQRQKLKDVADRLDIEYA